MKTKLHKILFAISKPYGNLFDLTQIKTRHYIIIVLAIIMSFIAPCNNKAQAIIGISCYYEGYWGEWNQLYTDIYGNYGGFILYKNGEHKSNYFFKFEISHYITPTKKNIRYMKKNNRWFEYEGTVEYWVHEDYPTIKDVFRKFGCPKRSHFETNYMDDKKPTVKRVAKAKIKIAPDFYKNHPRVYNIWFDDVAFAIDLRTNSFKKQ